ncbi:MAG TPA: hypothetical protein VGI76_02840 [Solirubrobacteraceae bacterium]|jgi:hypothetical protein
MARELDWFCLRFPRTLDAAAALAALSSFTGLPHAVHLTLGLTATAEEIRHDLAVSRTSASTVAGALHAAIPSLHLENAEVQREPAHRILWQLAPAVAAIRTDRLEAASASLLGSLSPLGRGELVSVRWHLRPSPRPRLDFASESARAGRTLSLRHKLALPGMGAYGELRVTAGTPQRRHLLIQRVATSLRALSTPHGRLVADAYWLGQLARLVGLRGRYLSVAELAAVLGWPVGAPDLPGLELGASRRLVPSRYLPEAGRLLGVSNFAAPARPVALTPQAATKGSWIIGPTGTGKTSLIKNMVVSDLEQGRGLAVIETNGDLIRELCDLIPKNRIRDVVLIDPTDPTHAVGFNPFRGSPDPSLVADQLGELFERLWSAFWGPRTAQLAHMGLLSLAQRPGSTLLDLPRLYLDPGFRRQVIAGLDDPVGLEPDWHWFESLSGREQAAIAAPLLNKARQFVARPAIRAIVGQAAPKVSVQRVMAEGKVLLVHLPKGLIGAETAQLLGCLTLTGLWQAATERTRLAPAQRPAFGIYVDEVQDFAASPIPWEELFAQGRKYGLSLAVAHQNLGQLPKELRETIEANARTKVAFALSPGDARALERHFAPALNADDLQALDAYSVAAVVALDSGAVSRPVTLDTPPPPEPVGSAAQVLAASRGHYARSRVEIEAAARARLRPAAQGSAPIGRRPRGNR